MQPLTTTNQSVPGCPTRTTTLSFALPEQLRADIEERVRTGPYGNTSEYLRELIRLDQEEHAKQRLRALPGDK